MAATTYEKYAWSSADEAAQHAAENYERYFVPSIGIHSARPLIEAAGLQEGERVLDLACGTGVTARLAAEQVGTAGTVVGVDPHPGMLAAARARTPEGPTVEWHQGAAEHIPLPDETFDAVVCSISFQFFADKAAALREIGRVLVPGGRVAIGTPGPTPPLMGAIDDVLIEHVGPEVSMFVQGVFSVHDPEEVRAQLEDAGFVDVEAERTSVSIRVPAPADFFWQYVNSTPLAPIATGLDADTLAAIEGDVVERLQPFVDGEGMTMDPGLLVATARRP